MKEPKPITVKKSVKHTFCAEEIANLNKDFGAAYDAVKSAEADFDAVKAVHKSKLTEAESKMTTLRATINAGFEYREKECVVIFRTEQGQKDFYLPSAFDNQNPGIPNAESEPVLTEPMTAADFEQGLIQAESAFENRVELILWEAGGDEGRMIVGSLKGKWFTAIRGNVGAQKIEERLDGEQMATKKRFDAIARAAKRVQEWLKATLGKDAAKGFEEPITNVVEGEKERVE